MNQVLQLPDRPVSLVMEKPLTVAEFLTFSLANPELVMEREADGKINIMSPVGFRSGKVENLIATRLTLWSLERGAGEVLSSSTGFTLPDGSVRSPDAAWVSTEQLAGMEPEELDRFAAIVPEFVVEVRSKSDSLATLRDKMQQVWIANGTQLAWLIDLQDEQIFVYRSDGSVAIVESFSGELSGEDVLPDFRFDLTELID